MSAAQNDRRRRLFHPGNQLGYAKPGFNVTAGCIEQHQHRLYFLALLNGCNDWHQMLILCCFGAVGQRLMPLDLTYDGKTVYGRLSGDSAGKIVNAVALNYAAAAVVIVIVAIVPFHIICTH